MIRFAAQRCAQTEEQSAYRTFPKHGTVYQMRFNDDKHTSLRPKSLSLGTGQQNVNSLTVHSCMQFASLYPVARPAQIFRLEDILLFCIDVNTQIVTGVLHCL